MQILTNRHFQYLGLSSVTELVNERTVIPEVLLPQLLPSILQCEYLQLIWIHGMPFGLSHLAKHLALLPKILVTHSLVPSRSLISHHFKLADVLPSVHDDYAFIQIGTVCQPLKWKLHHRDGRTVQPGFVGEFTAIIDGQEHHSGVLVRQCCDSDMQELITLNSAAYYSGKDVTDAVTILSKISEVTWIHTVVNLGTVTQLCYAVHESDSMTALNVHKAVKNKLLEHLPPPFANDLVQLQSPPPINEELSLDYSQLKQVIDTCYIAEQDHYRRDSVVFDRVAAVVRKVFQLKEAENCRNLVAYGTLSLAHILNLTIELNMEFESRFSVQDVHKHAISTSHLANFVHCQLHK